MTVRLAVFDCDGTLSDGQAAICAAMAEGFAEAGLTAPDPHQVRRIVGLSLPSAIARLAPGETPAAHGRVVAAYKQAFFRARERGLVRNRCSKASPRCSAGCTAPAGRSASPPASPTAAFTAA